MKKVFILLIVVILISCNSVKYIHSGNVNSRLNFKKGKWLLNEITATKDIKHNLTRISNEKFSELLGGRFVKLNDARGVLIPRDISSDPSKFILKDIKNGTGFDFFIDIRAKKKADEVDVFGGGNVMSSSENIGEITLIIYDLNLLEKVYSQSIIGKLFVPENKENFALSKSAGNIIICGLERIFKKIKKNQITE